MARSSSDLLTYVVQIQLERSGPPSHCLLVIPKASYKENVGEAKLCLLRNEVGCMSVWKQLSLPAVTKTTLHVRTMPRRTPLGSQELAAPLFVNCFSSPPIRLMICCSCACPTLHRRPLSCKSPGLSRGGNEIYRDAGIMLMFNRLRGPGIASSCWKLLLYHWGILDTTKRTEY